MKKYYKLFFVVGFVFLVTLASYYESKSSPKQEVTFKTSEESDQFVRFDMETYDKISEIYWMKTTDEQLADLFKASLDKVTNSTNTLTLKNRQGTAQMLASAFLLASSTEQKKQLSLNVAMVVLYNLLPAGRNGLLSDKQETAFRQNVSNIDPAKDLYAELGLQTGASIKEVEIAYKEKANALKNATSSEDKAKLQKISYSHSVLSNKDSKVLYDEAKIEPTLSSKKIGTTLYVNMTKISPTTLIEFVRTIENASTTKGLDSMIIDFRGNIGGSLDFLTNLFGLFVGNNQYVFDFFHQGEYLPQRSVQPKYPELSRFKEIAILVDNMTQSTAELTTATFKKFNMAKVVGVTTRGWGTIENTYPMETEIEPGVKYSLLLVNNITLREDGEPIEGRGVDPNVDIRQVNWQNEVNKNFISESLINAIKKEIMVK